MPFVLKSIARIAEMPTKTKHFDDDMRICRVDEFDDQDNVKRILDDLFTAAKNFRYCGEYRKLIDFISNFRQYSAFNAALVYAQKPGARYVLPAKRWQDDYGRTPKNGAQPLVMLQPMSPVMFGFDVSETEGRPLPEGFENPFYVDGRFVNDLYRKLLDQCASNGIQVIEKSMGSTLGGYVQNVDSALGAINIGLVRYAEKKTIYRRNKEIDVIAEITLNSNFPDETNFATLAHELGHLFCGHIGATNPPIWPGRINLGIEQREFEAESVSFLVCRRLGLDTPSAGYLSGYLEKNAQIPDISFDVVLKAVQRIETMCRSRKF